MPILNLITWNMQGGNANKWSRILNTGAELKCLQECSAPHSQFKDKSGNSFAMTSAQNVRLSYGVEHEEEKDNLFGKLGISNATKTIKKVSIDELSDKVNYGASRGYSMYVTKFAPFGNKMVQKYQYKVEENTQNLIDIGAEIARHLEDGYKAKARKLEPRRIEELKAQQKNMRRKAVVASRIDPSTNKFRYSRCNTAIGYRPTDMAGARVNHLSNLEPPNLEFQRCVQCLELDFEADGVFIIFNIHSVASGAAWSYFARFLPEFDRVAAESAAVAWLCLGDFNLHAPTMVTKLQTVMTGNYPIYGHRRVIYSEGTPTHFSGSADPAEDASQTADLDLDLDETSRQKMSEMIEQNSEYLDKFVGRNLDYMVMSTPFPFAPGDDPEFPWVVGTSGFLSDHRPVEIAVDTDRFAAIREALMSDEGWRQARARWIADRRVS